MNRPTVLDLFSGVGGFSLGLTRAGFRTVAFCEIEAYPRSILKKHWPDVPIFEDIKKLKGTDIDEPIDVICGGFPCQPWSIAGKRQGKDDDRHLWPEMLRIISEVKPHWVIAENVPGIINMGLDAVLSDLENQGYETASFIIPACAVNAPHRRDRVWIVANAGINTGDSRRAEPERQQWQAGFANGRHEIVAHAIGSMCDRRPDIPKRSQEERTSFDGCGETVADATLQLLDRTGSAGPSRGHEHSDLCGVNATNPNGERLQECDIAAISGRPGYFAREDFDRITRNNWITECQFCRTYDGVPERLDNDVNNLHSSDTHDIMGKTIQGELCYAEKNDPRQPYILRILRERIEQKGIQWTDRGSDKIFEAEILRTSMLWVGYDEKDYMQNDYASKSEEVLKEFVRELWYEKKPSGPSYRWRYNEQFEEEHRDIVFLLSLEMALEEWENHAEKTVGMSNLWRAIEEIGLMPKTLSEIKALWRSMPYEEKSWCIICAGTGDRFYRIWPGVNPVSTGKTPSRGARLKALGNAVVPQIPELIGRWIMEIENKCAG